MRGSLKDGDGIMLVNWFLRCVSSSGQYLLSGILDNTEATKHGVGVYDQPLHHSPLL